MLIKYNSFATEENEKYERRVILQSIEDTINMLRAHKENSEELYSDRQDKKLTQLMKEKSKLRSELYSL